MPDDNQDKTLADKKSNQDDNPDDNPADQPADNQNDKPVPSI
jgi:hypothetical protein